MIPHTDDCSAGQTCAVGEENQSNAHIDLKVTRSAPKQVLVRACATLTAACLVMGLVFTTFEPDQFHDVTRVLSARVNQSENGSKILLGSIGVFRPGVYSRVSSIRVCNKLDETPVRLVIVGKSKLQGNPYVKIGTAWVSVRHPCTSIPTETLESYFPYNTVLRCWYVAENAVNNQIPCDGGDFYYSRYSLLSGEYDCGGSPPTCSKQGYCQGSICWQTR
jgi:hypothetical protein